MSLVGADGPAVVVSGRVARMFTPVLVAAIRKARDAGQYLDVELVATVRHLEEAGEAFVAARGAVERSAVGMSGIPPGDESATMSMMSTTDVARRLGCGTRNVRALAERGTLPGRRVGSVWSFEAADVEDYLERKANA